MDFVNRLRLDHLHSFWYFPSKVNFALIGTFGSLLLATAPYQEEVEFYRTRLAEYRWTLGVSSKSAEFLGFARDSLDASGRLLRGLPERPAMPTTAEAAEAGVVGSSGQSSSSPGEDEPMGDAPGLHLEALPAFAEGRGAVEAGGRSSGLVSPSTSTESGEEGYETYGEELEGRMGGQGGYEGWVDGV